MSGLKQLRDRIRNIKSTQKITKAMQVVSSAKLAKIKNRAEILDDYSSILAKIMNDIRKNISFTNLTSEEKKFFSNNSSSNKSYLLVVMTSERGLCGSFNSQIIRAVKSDIAKFTKENITVKLIIIGKKGYDALKGNYSDLIEEYYHINKDDFFPLALKIKGKVINLIKDDKAEKCYLYYNEFKNALTQIMTKVSIFPLEEINLDESEKKDMQDSPTENSGRSEYEGNNLVETLINLYVSGLIKYGFLQNKASEEAARMTAMDSATRNAGELIDKLTLQLNRSRQSMITTELIEIISGAEAL